MKPTTLLALLAVASLAPLVLAAVPPKPANEQYKAWKNGPSTDESFFPIAVWLQSPRRAPAYKAIGVNTYIGLWKGPTEAQLTELKKHRMKVICAQNEVGPKHRNDKTIIAWMHGDEPDNQRREDGQWKPVAYPKEIVADYVKWKRNDPTRPIFLNLGQGVANDGYKGKWVKDHKTYAQFLQGCDIVSYDVYPVVGNRPETNDKLWLVSLGVDRLYTWGKGKKIVWNILECTGISNPKAKPTPKQVKAEVWMSLVHGSTGICYFCHEFTPNTGGEAALLRDKAMAEAVGKINKQIAELAAVLNSKTIDNGVRVTSSNEKVPVDVMVKRHKGATYAFAVSMRPGKTTGHLLCRPCGGPATVEVLGEDRKIEAAGGKFSDTFDDFDVHLYKISNVR